MRELELHRPQAVLMDAERSSGNHGVFTAQPFERGWGVTLGNAFRRILLSSIEGSAVTAVRFAGVDHEYDSIPGVIEDVTDLILNLKRVPMRLQGIQTLTATLRAAKAGTLKASAIKGSSELEIVDPEVYLATLSEDGAIEAELVIERGRGYAPADEHAARDLGVGYIYLDAAFSPVRRANYRIEPARVGQATDYEKLILEVWTNGAIPPAVAVAEAAALLGDHLPIFSGLQAEAAPIRDQQAESVLEMEIEGLELTGRTRNMLHNAGVFRVRDLVSCSEEKLLDQKGFGKTALAEVKGQLESLGLSLGMRFDLPRS
ncbi:MAG: DNA-directed RNA polymerase subunit alpha [Acidobacteriota bacterium]